MPEISSNTEIHEKEKVSLPSKKDIIDYEVLSKDSLGWKTSIAGASLMFGGFALRALDEDPDLRRLIPLTLFTGASLFFGSSAGIALYSERKEREKYRNSINDKDLGFIAERLVYRGAEPITVESKQFSEGSNFFYIKLPEASSPDTGQTPDLSLQMDLYNYAIRKSKKFASGRTYDFVVLDLGYKQEPSGLLPNAEIAQKRDVLRDKSAEIKGEERNVMLLSKEQFETMSATLNELFEKAKNNFNDPIFNSFVDLARTVRNSEEKDRVQKRMLGRLDSVLRRELESNFNALPEVVITRLGDTLEPIRRKVYTQAFIKETEKGLMFIQTNTANGETKYVPVNRLLKTKDKPIEEIIASKSHLKKGQLALILRDFITESDLEDLLKEKETTREELIDKMKNSGYKISEQVSESKNVVKRPAKKRVKTKIKSALAGVAITATGFGAITALDSALDLALGGSGGQSSEYGENGQAREEQISNIEFPGLPPLGIEWEIGGTISPSGYYMTSTANEFRDKRWIKNEEIDSEIKISTEYDASDGRLLTLSRPILLNQFGETSFKLPIRENTLLTAVKISDPDGNPLDRTIYRLTDGSIKVVITPGLLGTPAYAEIFSSFTQNSGNMVHATKSLPELDKSKLSDDVKKDLEKASSLESDLDGLEYLRTDIRDGHLYSIDPPDKDKLSNAHSAEDVVNAIEDLSGCSCEICNTQLVLTSGTVGGNETVNMAYGYIAMGNHIAGSEDNFLKSETRHAFAIQQDGYILDATATNSAEDELTQRYLEILATNYASSPDEMEPGGFYSNYFNNLRENAKSSKEQSDFLKLVAGLLAGGTSILLARQLYGKGRKIVTAENVEKLSNSIISDVIDRKALSKAYHFFSWISWAKPEFRLNLTEPVKADNNVDLFQKIKGTVSYDKIAQYIEDPAAFERIAREHGFSFTKLDKMKLRMLANYLLKS